MTSDSYDSRICQLDKLGGGRILWVIESSDTPKLPTAVPALAGPTTHASAARRPSPVIIFMLRPLAWFMAGIPLSPFDPPIISRKFESIRWYDSWIRPNGKIRSKWNLIVW
jgi:hypothetical protein